MVNNVKDKINFESLPILLLDYFDLDIQIYTSNLSEKTRNTKTGKVLAKWAVNNPNSFKNLLRISSTLIERFPSDDSLFVETITQHLLRLPPDIYRIFNEKEDNIETINSKYDTVLKHYDGNELLLLSTLEDEQLIEWHNSSSDNKEVLMDAWLKQSRKYSGTLSNLYDRMVNFPEELLIAGESIIPDVEKKGLFHRIFQREISGLTTIWHKITLKRD